MALTDKTRLLKAIINKSEGFLIYGNDTQNDHETFSQLLSSLLKHYKQEHLMMAVKKCCKTKSLLFFKQFYQVSLILLEYFPLTSNCRQELELGESAS